MDAGSVVYIIKAETDQLLKANKQVDKFLSQLQSSFDGADKAADSLGGTLKQAGSAIDDTSSAAGGMAKNVAAVEGAIGKLNTNINSLTRAILESRSGVSGASSEFSRAESIIESLGNQLAILEEQQEGSARSAAILAAQLRAGSNATEAEKKTIADLTGRLYDMKNGTEAGAKGTKNWKSTMQQAGYQVNDFIVQVQGGQSALVAFSQQGSQLAGAFGPGGAVIGAVIALGSVMAGTLITSLNGGKNAMDALKDATEAMDRVINISQNGVAALSDKYAMLAKTNAEAATILRNQAIIEYNVAVSKIPKTIGDAAASVINFGDKALSAFSGGYASIQGFGDRLAALEITTDDYSEAMKQAYGAGQAFEATANSIGNTVGSVASKFGISEQAAFKLVKQMDEVQRTRTPEALQRLVIELQNTKSSSDSGASSIAAFLKPLTELVGAAGMAKVNLAGMNSEMDLLTTSQKNLIKQSERNLELSKLQGEARARLQAQYAAEDAGFAKDDPHTRQMMDDAAATYKNTEAQKNLRSEHEKGATQAESIAQKLANLKQQSDLAADSTNKLSREQTILNAQQSLGKGATKEQLALAGRYAAKKWDTANAIKAQAAAEKLLPEARENASYKQDVDDLKTALAAKKISQEQFNQTSERLEAAHQVNLAKIRAQQTVTPQQSALGEIDPVQQLANQHAQELALIQQFETQKGQITQRGLELMNAANTEYEQARIAAQWEIYRNQSTTNQLMADAIDSLQGGATNAITGLLNGTQSLQESFANIGTTILNSVVGSLVQMGIEWVKSQLMGQAAAAASLASTMAQATAAASAWAPAAMSASIATMGSATAIGQTAYAGSLLAAKGMAVAGARYNGGPVDAGSMYRVGERGKPEIFQAANGSQYMIPGDNGRVISNKDMQGGGGAVIQQQMNVTIHTTNGITEENLRQIESRMYKVGRKAALDEMFNQQRPKGILPPRR
ncbi:phage tail length tape measure family protein [Enterobacter hormaechei]|uniref:phage tail length tape measure family protein n=1 Tax=Enterobacter hormaechei TaxID=158836 RepID=UPI0027EA9C37|nr:phage tail length tape measure family protein [Enterobacter hormaechei]HED3104536.1 phage tail length tape measure family protein [Enterobacter hormaechei subsp. steigerwaltii]EKY7868280.1 phage tail length tape measure family protein [Enterobacter hormaechei]MDT8097286.1 phage tail length tape measure family protein [Enterobacter hormaechei]MDT8251466.1 phage tail length tape measure family protein [Enterobacter hormaechei]MDY7178935.1 phage tail length tape measure family protein [Enterob